MRARGGARLGSLLLPLVVLWPPRPAAAAGPRPCSGAACWARIRNGSALGAVLPEALGGQSRAAGCVLVVVQPCGRLGNLLFQLAAALSAARAAAGALCVAVADDGLARRYANTVLRAVGGLLVAPGLLQQEGRAANATREACGLSEVAVPKGRFLAGGVSSCIAWKAFSRWCGRSGARCQRMDAGAPDGGGDWAEPLAEALLGYRRRGGGVEPCSMVWLSGYFQDLRYFGAHLAWLRGLFWHAPSAQRAEGMLASVAPPGRGVAAAIHYRFGDLWHWFPGDVLYDGYQGWASSLAKERVNRELTCLVFSDAPSTARRSIEVLDGCSEVKMMMDVGDVLSFYMMAAAPVSIVAESSFSYWAALLAAGKSLVVVPELGGAAWLAQPAGWAALPAYRTRSCEKRGAEVWCGGRVVSAAAGAERP